MEHLEVRIINMQHDIIRDILFLNGGGCGVFALMMHKQLKKLGVDSRMLIVDEENLTHRKNVLNARINGDDSNYDEDEYLAFDHCLVKVGNLIFDGTDFVDNPSQIVGEYTAEEMQVALDSDSWSDWYSREQNPLLEEIIQRNFEC